MQKQISLIAAKANANFIESQKPNPSSPKTNTRLLKRQSPSPLIPKTNDPHPPLSPHPNLSQYHIFAQANTRQPQEKYIISRYTSQDPIQHYPLIAPVSLSQCPSARSGSSKSTWQRQKQNPLIPKTDSKSPSPLIPNPSSPSPLIQKTDSQSPSPLI